MSDWFCRSGLRFSCMRCSACCRHESGFVFLSESDAAVLAGALSVLLPEFEALYCRWVRYGEHERLSLKEKPNFDCIFWGNGCAVYENRPFQCRSYPFWEFFLADKGAWDQEAIHCAGMGKGRLYSFEEIEEFLTQDRRNPVIERKRLSR